MLLESNGAILNPDEQNRFWEHRREWERFLQNVTTHGAFKNETEAAGAGFGGNGPTEPPDGMDGWEFEGVVVRSERLERAVCLRPQISVGAIRMLE